MPIRRQDLRTRGRLSRATTALIFCLLPASVHGQSGPPSPDSLATLLSPLSWRSIGPAEAGGRTTDVAGIPGDPSTAYFGTATAGVWKTEDGGITFRSIFESAGTQSIGSLAIAPSDPNVIYVGTGEGNPRNSTSIGDGVYRSTDAGESWTRVGLESTERVSRIRVHPSDPDVVYVGALGHLWGPNEERGVYRSRDGGASWERVLYVDENTGVADLAIDPTNPRILYAAMWDFRRQPWHFRSGGPGSGLYRSKDGGDTWRRLTDPALSNGLPTGTLGRMGIAVAASDPRIVYAIIESEDDGVLWRSDDGGERWTRVSDSGRIGSRPFYYSDIRVDPKDPNTVYALASGFSKSIDGGRTWEGIAGNIHGDHHALWIDPENPGRLINGNDGGFHFSPDGGDTWRYAANVPLAQFYQISADDRMPYTVCGGLQDMDVWCGPSRTLNVTGALPNAWHEIVGPGDGTYVQFDPRNPDRIYTATQGGSFYLADLSTGEARDISPYPPPAGGLNAGSHEYRFNWNAPIHQSPNDPSVVYVGGNVLFRSDDAGQSWAAISPDLSNAEPEKLGYSGGLTMDNTTAEYHATIYTISESPVETGVIWVGTDDGNVQVTRDGGATWTEVSEPGAGRSGLPGVPSHAWVSRIEASTHAAGAAWVSVDAHRQDDMSPHIFATTDYGTTWRRISGGLPTPGYVHVVREDPRVPGLLYAGTETGVWFSPPPGTGGAGSGREGGGVRRWVSLRLGLPRVPVRDLFVHPRDNDLVMATHGRGAWILDDLGPVQRLEAGLVSGADVHLFPPRDAVRFEPSIRRFRFDLGDDVFVGENPPYGASIDYFVRSHDATIDDAAGAEPSSGDAGGGDPAVEGADPGAESGDPGAEGDDAGSGDDSPGPRLLILSAAGDTVRTLDVSGDPGLHRVAWDLRAERYDDAEEGYRFGVGGPRVLPGTYTLRLDVAGTVAEASLDVVLDPRLSVTPDELRAQVAALDRIGAAGTEAAEMVRELDRIREQLERWRERLADEPDAPGALADTARALLDGVDSVRVHLEWPDDDQLEMDRVPLIPGLSAVARQVGRASGPPTDAQLEWVARYEAMLPETRDRFDAYLARVRAFNDAVAAAGLEPVRVRAP